MADEKSEHEHNPPLSPSLLQWFDEMEKNEAAAKFNGHVNNTNAVGADGRTMTNPQVPCFDFLRTEGTSDHYGNTDFGYSVTLPSVANASSNICNFGSPYVDRDLVSVTGSCEPLNSIQQHGDLNSCTSNPMSWPTVDGGFLTLGVGCHPVNDVAFDSEANTNRSMPLSSDVATRFPSFQNSKQHVEEQQQFPEPGDRNACLGAEGNCNGRASYFNVNNGIQGYPTKTSLPVDNSLARLPDSGFSKMNELSKSSCLNTSTPLSLSDQSQKNQIKSGSRNTSMYIQSGKPFSANEGVAAFIDERSHVPEELRFNQLYRNCHQPRVASAVTSSTEFPGSVITGQEFPTTKVNLGVQPSKPLSGTSVKRPAPEPLTASSPAEASKMRRIRPSTGLSVQAPFKGSSSLRITSHEASLASRDHTSPSLLHQAKNTTLNNSQSYIRPALPPFQNTPSLAPQVKHISSLPSQTHAVSSIQSQAMSRPLLQPRTSSTPTRSQGNEFFQHQSQMAQFLLPQALTTASLPHPYVGSLRPMAYTRTRPTVFHNGLPWPPQVHYSFPFPLQHTTGQAMPPNSLRGSPLIQKPHIALPPRSQTASPSGLTIRSPLPPQFRTASPVPQNLIAPPSSSAPPTISPVTQKVIARPLPPQRQADQVPHIKWEAIGEEPQLIGHKCLICKRDLTFTPEGPVSVPPVAPIAAVLPCGHTFHDHCLQLITPKDDLKNPPCIPCAIGES